MTEHPSLEAVALWVVDPGASVAEIGKHVGDCAKCRGLADRLRELAHMASDVLGAEPPERVFERASALVPSPERSFAYAETIEDSSVLVGVRDESSSGRILIYRAGDFDLHVQMVPWDDGRRTNLLGQVYGPGEGAGEATVSIVGQDQVLAAATTNEFGEFRVTAALRLPFHFQVETAKVRFRTSPVLGWTPL